MSQMSHTICEYETGSKDNMSGFYSSKNISKNVVASILQVVVSGVVFFVLYRFLYDLLGVEKIGVWALVLAATSISRVGELGLSASVVRYAAQAIGRDDRKRAAEVVQSTVITLGVFFAVLLVAAYPLFSFALSYLLPVNEVQVALSILPYALFSFWLMVLVGVFGGGLDSCMRIDIRCGLTALSHIGYLFLSLYLVPISGLKGLAIAQVMQSICLMFFLWVALKTQIRELPVIPLVWRYSVIKEMISYGIKFQVISILSMLLDPLIKALMSKFGGLDSLGYFEMASQFVLKGRAVVIEASRVMVPAIARLQEVDSEKSHSLFINAHQMNLYASIVFFGVLGVFIAVVSKLWIGEVQEAFVSFALLLNLGWFVNALIGPAYFSNLGSGRLQDNMVSYIIMAVCSATTCTLLGVMFGEFGVATGASFSLVVGSLYLVVSYFRKMNNFNVELLFPEDARRQLVVGVILVLVSNYVGGLDNGLMVIFTFSVFCASVFVAYSIFFSKSGRFFGVK